ncbi:hypothetical protein CBR_g36800 [Chara braunii]|uniref:Uncharacterized protein n=1 Tax=Chara braunii TaxID=69332 RepID=A0A388LLL1_CHABU|nr:hypothetical protein CBR_g36800 [Chara braunii]|eukprot:GBG83184.1 hypothetical protein CBR_g36800 [Chara braunii]
MALTACRSGGVGGRRKAQRNTVRRLPLATNMMMDCGGRSVHMQSCRLPFQSALPFLISLVHLLFLLLAFVVVPQSADAVNLYDRLYARGGRSFSVIDPDNMTVVWDSGDAFERTISVESASYFNSRGFTAAEFDSLLERRILNQTAGPLIRQDWLESFRAGTVDSQSTKLGCRPRALVLGMMNGGKDRYLFVALTNPAGIMVYNFSNPVAPTFKTWTKLLTQHLEPEALHFTEADQTDAPYLYVTCGFSASLLVFQVNADGGLTTVAAYDGTMGVKPVPFGARLINGLTTYTAMGFVPDEDSIFGVPMILVANQYARRVEVFLFNTTATVLQIQRLGDIDLSTGIASMNSTAEVFKPGFPTDVYVQGNVLAVTVVPFDPSMTTTLTIEQQAAMSPGSVLFYQLNYDGTFPFTFLNSTDTGSYPKKTVCGGSQCLVVNYAKWAQVNRQGAHIDPPGGVTVIRMPNDVYSLTGALKELGSANHSWSSYVVNLVFERVILDEEVELPGTGLVAADPQPIDIALNNVSTIAYVLLRSSNAIAKLNLTTMEYTKVYWLGAKNYSSVAIDPSSQDGGPNLRTFDNLYGLYMPSRMKVIPSYPPFGSKEYIITVNEGEDVMQPGGNVTVKDLQLDPVTFPNAAELQSPANLGDLSVVAWKGLKSQLHTELYSGLSRTAETPCDTYSYFQFEVNSSYVCMDMHVQLAAMQGTPDIYVSKDPAHNPEIYDLTWSNYESTSDNVENFVISHLDPEFQPGVYYFGVYAYCEPAQKEAAIYNITVTLEEPASKDPADDLARFPAVNVQPRVDGPQYYSFCMVHPCAPIQVNLSDCRPGANFCPELLMSTSVVHPEVEDYTWKTMAGRRGVSIAPGDAYNQAGVFYVGVISRCVDPDPANCATANPESAFNLSVTYPSHLPEACPDKPYPVLLSPSDAVVLQQNLPVNQSTTCGEYSYFSIRVDDPCEDLVIETTPACPTCGLPRIFVTKDFVSSPKDDDRTWSSDQTSGKSSVTVSAFDRDFSVEGMFFVGVQADCSAASGNTPPLTAVSYSIVAQLSSAHVYRWENVTQMDMMNKMISDQYVGVPLDYHYYHFCVRNRTSGNVVVTLDNCVSTTSCPNTYWWPEMLVSKVRWNPTVSDRAWRLAQLNRNSITLRATDPDVRPGHYFVGVYAWCNKDCNASQAQAGQACAPCENILHSPYNLTVQQGNSPLEIVPPVPVDQLGPQSATVSVSSPPGNSAGRVGFSSGSWKDLLRHVGIAAVVAVFVAFRPLEVA